MEKKIIEQEQHKLISVKKLTKKFAEENNLTPFDLIRHFNPDWSDERCDYYLWEETCFPFSTEVLINQLNKEFLNK